MRKSRQVAVVFVAVVAIVASACTPKQAPGPVAGGGYDVVIQNARVVDGTGDAWFNGDVAIQGDRIARVTRAGLLRDAAAKQRIDATGMVVAPGFIDIQGQSMMQLTFGDGRLLSKVTQGVTTEIMGEGSSFAPVNDKILALAAGMIASLKRADVQPKLASFKGEHAFGMWLDSMQAHGMSTNAGSFLGAETIRVYTKGAQPGAPSASELDTMRLITRNAMRDGAMGVASALIYPPGNYATTEELIEIAKAMSPLGGLYITHMRSEGDGFLEAIDEAMRIGREGGVPVEIFHLKAAGVRNWPKAKLAIAKIDSARAAGQDVQANMYPYIAGGTGLSACTPPWASENGKLLDNLKDPATRKKITTEMHAAKTTWENLCNMATPAGVMVMGFEKPEMKQYEGKRLGEIAASMKEDWADAVADVLLATEARVGMVIFMMNEENVELQLKQPWLKIGTDADGEDPDSAKGSLTHPRTYGTYPRILGHYVRDRHVISLEEAIRKMTSAVATRLSIPDRGLLKEGMFADVVVFDPATIIDKATFTEPHQVSEGVKYVFVNGVQVLADGKHTGAKPGRIIRGPGWTGRTP